MIKKLGILTAYLGVIFTLNAQSECETDYAIYINEYKMKNYDEALKNYRKVFKN